jgi:hypothetical protein
MILALRRLQQMFLRHAFFPVAARNVSLGFASQHKLQRLKSARRPSPCINLVGSTPNPKTFRKRTTHFQSSRRIPQVMLLQL